MFTTARTRRRWASRARQLNAWSRELHDRANECGAAFQQLESSSPDAELVFTGTRDILRFAAHQVDQAAEALTMIVELVDATDPRLQRVP